MSTTLPDDVTTLKLTYQDLVDSPVLCAPTFPPYCVECGEPTTIYREETHTLNRKVGQKAADSLLDMSDLGIYEPIDISLKVALCEKHKADYDKAGKSMWIEIALALVLAAAIGGVVILLGDYAQLPGGVTCVLIPAIALLVVALSAKPIHRLMARIMGYDESSEFSASVHHDKTPEGGELHLIFGERPYAEMFAEANDLLID